MLFTSGFAYNTTDLELPHFPTTRTHSMSGAVAIKARRCHVYFNATFEKTVNKITLVAPTPQLYARVFHLLVGKAFSPLPHADTRQRVQPRVKRTPAHQKLEAKDT